MKYTARQWEIYHFYFIEYTKNILTVTLKNRYFLKIELTKFQLEF